MIKFAGIRSDEVNLIIEHYPTRQFPEKNYDVIEVPGKDGDVVIDKGNFKNYRQSYSAFIDANSPDEETYYLVSTKIAEWLLGNPGYQRLEDSYDPEFYRMAYYSGGSNFSNFFNVYGRGTIEFTCAPRRFYKYGEKEIEIESGFKIDSPSVFKAEPLFKITPTNAAPSLTVNGKTVSFDSQNAFVVDTTKHTSKKTDGTYVNMTSGNYEDLFLSKENTITFTGCSSVVLIPRWWTI